MIDIRQIKTVAEANQNFSKAKHIADEHGEAIVFKNNRPRYKLVNLELKLDLEFTDDEKIDIAVRRVLKRHQAAFLELAN